MNISLLILGVVILLSTLLFGLIFIYLGNANQGVNRARGKQKKRSPLKTKRLDNRSSNRVKFKPSYVNDNSEIRIEQVSRPLQNKLLLLLNGDRNTANRLLNLAKTRNPQKSVQWCAEKVIFDLQRDRGRY